MKYKCCFIEDSGGNKLLGVKFTDAYREVRVWYPRWDDLRDIILEAVGHEKNYNRAKDLFKFETLIEAIRKAMESEPNRGLSNQDVQV